MIDADKDKRIKHNENIVEELCPVLVSAVREKDPKFVIIYRNSFAGDYQTEELALLGRVVKYFAERGKEVRIVPEDHNITGNMGDEFIFEGKI